MRDLNGTPRRRAVLLAVGTLLVLLIAVVGLFIGHKNRPDQARRVPSPAIEASPTPAPTGAVTLQSGVRQVDGVGVGFPHSTIGAISAAAQYVSAVASTLDPDYAASLMRLVGDPDDPSLPGSLADSTVKLRGDLQLPATGPLPPPTSFQTTAQMYQLRAPAPDNVMVLLLASSTFINTRGGIAQTAGVFPVRMHWTSGDWHLADVGGAGQDYSNLAAAPDTQDAVNRGWQPLVAATGGTP